MNCPVAASWASWPCRYCAPGIPRCCEGVPASVPGRCVAWVSAEAADGLALACMPGRTASEASTTALPWSDPAACKGFRPLSLKLLCMGLPGAARAMVSDADLRSPASAGGTGLAALAPALVASCCCMKSARPMPPCLVRVLDNSSSNMATYWSSSLPWSSPSFWTVLRISLSIWPMNTDSKPSQASRSFFSSLGPGAKRLFMAWAVRVFWASGDIPAAAAFSGVSESRILPKDFSGILGACPPAALAACLFA